MLSTRINKIELLPLGESSILLYAENYYTEIHSVLFYAVFIAVSIPFGNGL